MPDTARVTVVTVSYNSAAVLPAMLDSVPAGTAVVIVDNGSADRRALCALAERHGARLVENDHNLGFGAACNRGAALARTDFVLFLNPDAVLEPGAIEALVAAAERHPTASAFNPRIARPDGKPLFKRRSVLLPRSAWLPRGWPETDREVPVLVGSALFVRRGAFETVGGFDPEIFLYHEDDDLALRLRAACGPLMFVRAACVRHAGGASSASGPAVVALKARAMGQSRVHAARKHGRPFPVAAALAAAALQLASPLTLVSARRRTKHWALLRGILDGAARTRAKLPEPA